MLKPSQIYSFKQKEGFQGRELMVQVQGTFSTGAFTVRKGSKVLFLCKEETQKEHAQNQLIPPGAVSPCPQVTCEGDLLRRGCKEPRVLWAEGRSPRHDSPGLSSRGKAKHFLWLCNACSSHRPPEEAGPLVACLVPAFPRSRSSWQWDSKGTPSLAHQRPGGKLPATQKPAPAYYLPHTKLSHICKRTSLICTACTFAN